MHEYSRLAGSLAHTLYRALASNIPDFALCPPEFNERMTHAEYSDLSTTATYDALVLDFFKSKSKSRSSTLHLIPLILPAVLLNTRKRCQ